jgi:DNA polymerase-3 subunit delta'
MKFSQIPGQKEITGKLIRSVHEERVSHAQLFAGPQGCGNLALALAFAQYVSCENKTPSDSCGTCKSCIKYEKMIHPDLHFVFPVVKSKKFPEPVSDNYISDWREFTGNSPYFTVTEWLDHIDAGNAQGLIPAAEAAEIIKKINLKTFESEFKIMIIWLPEKMHNSAANKVLKMIEEPPEKTLFLLVPDEPDKIIPTILSRCQMIRIPSFRNEDIESHISRIYNLSSEKLSDVSRVANGNIIRAIELCKSEETTMKTFEWFKSLMRFAWKRDVISIINWSEEMAVKGREIQKNFLAYALRMLRENLMLTLDQVKNSLVFLTGEEQGFSKKFHPFINQDNIYALADEFNEAYAQIESNGNAKIIFLDLALKVIKLIPRS